MTGRDVIVLCEGKRDVRLVESFYTERRRDVSVTRFLGETVEHSRQKNVESRAIRNFIEPYNPYDVLVKSEEGDDTLLPLFVKLVDHLIRIDPKPCLLIDLDTAPDESRADTYRTLIENVNERVSDNYSGKCYGVETVDRLSRSRELLATRCHLTDSDGVRGEFSVLAFHTNLEDAVETGGHHSEERQGEQLQAFVTSDDADPMREVL